MTMVVFADIVFSTCFLTIMKFLDYFKAKAISEWTKLRRTKARAIIGLLKWTAKHFLTEYLPLWKILKNQESSDD